MVTGRQLCMLLNVHNLAAWQLSAPRASYLDIYSLLAIFHHLNGTIMRCAGSRHSHLRAAGPGT